MTKAPANAEQPKWQWLIVAYLLLLTADIVFILFAGPQWRFFSKPLLMPLLLIWFLAQSNNIRITAKIWIAAALFFSWAGDLLLMFDHINSIYFMLGLAAFLTAHIFYCVYFANLSKGNRNKLPSLISFLVLAYLCILLYILQPKLGDMLWPVRVYGLTISVMLLLALVVHNVFRNMATKFMAIGAFFFVVSDSLLAINKFYAAFPFAGVAVMATYGIAQLLIVRGALLQEQYTSSLKPS